MQPNGTTADFPYGIDPRRFGLGKIEYDDALRHHREMEHNNIMREKWAEQDLIAAREAERDWWLRPLAAFFKWFGGAFWLIVWFYALGSILLAIAEWSARRDAQWCLKDVAKCERIAKGEKS